MLNYPMDKMGSPNSMHHPTLDHNPRQYSVTESYTFTKNSDIKNERMPSGRRRMNNMGMTMDNERMMYPESDFSDAITNMMNRMANPASMMHNTVPAHMAEETVYPDEEYPAAITKMMGEIASSQSKGKVKATTQGYPDEEYPGAITKMMGKIAANIKPSKMNPGSGHHGMLSDPEYLDGPALIGRKTSQRPKTTRKMDNRMMGRHKMMYPDPEYPGVIPKYAAPLMGSGGNLDDPNMMTHAIDRMMDRRGQPNRAGYLPPTRNRVTSGYGAPMRMRKRPTYLPPKPQPLSVPAYFEAAALKADLDP